MIKRSFFTLLFICCFVCVNKTTLPMLNGTCRTPLKAPGPSERLKNTLFPYMRYSIKCTTNSGERYFGQIDSAETNITFEGFCENFLPLLFLLLPYADADNCTISRTEGLDYGIWGRIFSRDGIDREEYERKIVTYNSTCQRLYHTKISASKKKKHKKMIHNYQKRAEKLMKKGSKKANKKKRYSKKSW